MPFLKDSLFLISSWKTLMSRAAHSSQDWDYEKGHLLGFLSVTPFSDLLLKGNLFSYAPLTQDMECFLALWRLLLAWLCSCSIFLLPKAALYEDTETCVSANKAPLFHSRLGSPESFFPSTPVPGVPVYKDCDKWRPNRSIKLDKKNRQWPEVILAFNSLCCRLTYYLGLLFVLHNL